MARPPPYRGKQKRQSVSQFSPLFFCYGENGIPHKSRRCERICAKPICTVHRPCGLPRMLGSSLRGCAETPNASLIRPVSCAKHHRRAKSKMPSHVDGIRVTFSRTIRFRASARDTRRKQWHRCCPVAGSFQTAPDGLSTMDGFSGFVDV